MSRYTYAGPFRNPTEGFYVKAVDEHFEIWVRSDRAKDGSAPPDHKHTSAPNFNEPEDAEEWISNLREFFEDDYDEYLEENHAEIARMEAYEDWRNEY